MLTNEGGRTGQVGWHGSRAYPALVAAGILLACGPAAGQLPAAEEPARGRSTIGITPVDTQVVIGCASCEGPAAITPIAMATGANGSTYIVDTFEPFIRVFDREGDHLFSFGQKGPGPADLRRPLVVFPEQDGSVWVHDSLPPGRLLRFDRSGTLNQVLELRQPGFNMSDMDPARSTFYTVAFERGIGAMVPLSALARLVSWDVSDGSGPMRVAPVEDPDPEVPESQKTREYRRWSIAVAPNGDIAIGYIHEYRIRIVDSDGLLKHEMQRDVPAVLDPRGRITPYFPAAGLDFDELGRLWVQRFQGDSGAKTTVFDVFGDDGGYLGEVELPERVLEQQLKAFEATSTELTAITWDFNSSERLVKRWDLQPVRDGGDPR